MALALEVAEAYDVLTDSNKRAVYDQYGEEGLKAPPGGHRRVVAADAFPFAFLCRREDLLRGVVVAMVVAVAQGLDSGTPQATSTRMTSSPSSSRRSSIVIS